MRILLFSILVTAIAILDLKPCMAGQRRDLSDSSTYPETRSQSNSQHINAEVLDPLTAKALEQRILLKTDPNVATSSKDQLKTLDQFKLKDFRPNKNAQNSQQIGLEPWVPGKGAVGIKVEVTW